MTITTKLLPAFQGSGDAISQQVREQIQAARKDAMDAAANARRAAAGPLPTPAIAGSEGTTAQQIPWDPNSDVPPRAMGLGIAFIVAAAAVLIFMPFTRALARAIDRSKSKPTMPAEVTAQLTQLTQAVDAIAVEVERISEGQRFTTRLLSEQQNRTLLSPAAGERPPGV